MRNDDTNFNFGENAPPKEDTPTYSQACLGMLVCPHCGRAAICGDIETIGGFNTMLPNAGNNAGAPPAAKGGRQNSGLPYIRTENLTTDPVTARVIDVRVAEPATGGRQNFSDIKIKIACKGATWLYGLKVSNPEYAKLVGSFGNDETQWPGREFQMYAEQDEFDGKLWIRVNPLEPKQKEKKK